jgi:prepilin-type N-terminal cleavage/methylation domain-containing protein
VRRETGVTLIELIVVLAIIGVMAAISGVAVAGLTLPRESEETAALRRARTEAIVTGAPVRAVDHRSPRTAHPLFLPDGRAVGSGVDPLTGSPREE